ncbi:MAG: hypothetical protein IPI67_04115 [Myxococcales bacterium]|nr:hypothetical protein [Myxococcales bacterium]
MQLTTARGSRFGVLTALAVGACGVAALPPPPAPAPIKPTPSASAAAASSAVVVPAPTPPPKARTPKGDVGTAGPLSVEAVARDGGWVCLCQARGDTNGDGVVAASVGEAGRLEGDQLQRFFIRGAGVGEAIDDLLSYDDSGRWVVLSRAGKVVLEDTLDDKEMDLGAAGLDTRNDSLSFRHHRALAFDPAGQHLAFIRGEGRATRVVVRTLATGAEVLLDPGPGDLWRIEVDPSGRYVVMQVLVDDTNKDKRISWPAPLRKSPRACRGPVATYDAWVGRGDEPVVRLAPLTGGATESVAGFVTALPSGVVLRGAGGKLTLRAATGTAELSPEPCGARVVLVDTSRDQLLVACTKAKGRPKLELVARRGRAELDADVAHQSQDLIQAATQRLFPLYPGSAVKLLDLVGKTLTPLSPGDIVLASDGSRALIRRKGQLVVFDVDGAKTEILDAKVDASAEAVVSAPFVAVAPIVANLASGSVIGSFDGRPLGLSPDGRVLVAAGGDGNARKLAVGPLVWRTPTRAAGHH